MIQRILLLVVVPATCLLLAVYLIASDARRDAEEAAAIAELAELTALTAALDAALGAETIAGADGFQTLSLMSASAATDRRLADFERYVQSRSMSSPALNNAIGTVTETLRFRDDMSTGIISPLQIGHRYRAARGAIQTAVADQVRRTSPGENTNDLSAMLALVDASSAQVDERLAVELALRYETWAPGQLAVVVGAIERQRVHLAEASTLYPGLDLSSDGELAHVRSTLLTNTELPVLDRSRWIALSNQWSDGLTTAIDEHAAAVAKNASLASRTARRSFQVTAIAGVAILLGAVALAALVARRRIQELADLEYRADYDALTGLANRSRSIREIEALCRNASSDARPALLFLDLDGFKAINDRYGHERGDQTLREVANRLRRAADDEVVIGRLGGDEFVAALPDARSREAVLDLATRLRAAILEAPTRAEISFDVSIGAAIHEPEQSYLDVLAAADAAMYAAKGTTQRFRFASHERADDQAPLQRQPATARAPQRSYELTR